MLLALLLSCSMPASPPNPPDSWGLRQISAGRGLSGLSRDPAGRLWAISERQPELIRLDSPGRIVIEGIPEGHDTEALTWLSADRIAIGTESHDNARVSDRVLIARVTGSTAVVEEQIELPFTVLGVQPESNRGLEAICVVGDRLLVVSELIIEDGARWAPFATRPLAGGPWTAGRLQMTTKTGKAAGLDCRGGHAWTIERHYGVARILHWKVPDDGGDVVPGVAVAVDELVQGTLPNVEGLAVSEKKIWLVTDNDHGGNTGPSWLFEIPRESRPDVPIAEE